MVMVVVDSGHGDGCTGCGAGSCTCRLAAMTRMTGAAVAVKVDGCHGDSDCGWSGCEGDGSGCDSDDHCRGVVALATLAVGMDGSQGDDSLDAGGCSGSGP